jgi:GH25 family lysozyme M1 (1,4-beta-N-acetylmuramidase)
MTLDMAREFLAGVADVLGRKPVFYSGHLIKEELGDKRDTFFGGHRLWLAHYAETPVTQKSWDKYWLWQFTDGTTIKVSGIPGDDSGALDCNFFAGTDADLRAQWAS